MSYYCFEVLNALMEVFWHLISIIVYKQHYKKIDYSGFRTTKKFKYIVNVLIYFYIYN
jgi:hypothetical protein